MSANLVCFISAKGGSGKTVTSSSMGAFLSELGFRVLLVDTDASTNGLSLLFLKTLLGQSQGGDFRGLFEVRSGGVPDVIESKKNLFIMPAAYALKDTENFNLELFQLNLREAIEYYRSSFDFIFLDAQAGADGFARIAAGQADQCVIVSEYDPVSAQGIDRLKILFGDIIGPASTWTLFNKVLPEFASAIGEGLAIARYLPPLPWDADVVRAFARRDLAIRMTAPNPYTLAVAQVVEELFPFSVAERIANWRNEALERSAAPIQEQIAMLRHEEQEIQAKISKQKVGARVVSVTLATVTVTAVALVSFSFLTTNALSVASTSFVTISAIAVAALSALVGTTAMSYLYRGVDQRSTHDLDLELVRMRLSKLSATLSATEKTLKSRREGGIFEEIRRGQEASRSRSD